MSVNKAFGSLLEKIIKCHDNILGEYLTFFLEDPSVRYKQYKTTAGMYINKSATRTKTEKEPYYSISNFATANNTNFHAYDIKYPHVYVSLK